MIGPLSRTETEVTVMPKVDKPLTCKRLCPSHRQRCDTQLAICWELRVSRGTDAVIPT